MEEIKRRTQGPDETIGTYMAIINRYFHRLQCPITEEAKLTILLRNIAPVYRNQLGAFEISSLAQLKTVSHSEVCRRIEHRIQTEDYAPSLTKNQSLEPDLAYVDISQDIDELHVSPPQTSQSSNIHCSNQRDVICNRCKKPGHRAIGCAEPAKLICYGCKREGHMKRDCRFSGNGNRRS